jgi:hypothetical protein
LGGGSDDDILCREIVAKFKAEGEGAVSYAEIARGAYEGGRSKLATMVCPLLSWALVNSKEMLMVVIGL